MRIPPSFFDRVHPALILVLAVLLTLLVGIVDYITADLSSAIFYLLPVWLVAWHGGRRRGFLIAAIAAAVWLAADLATPSVYSHTVVPFWNALVRFALFAIIVHLLCNVQTVSRRNAELAFTDHLTGVFNARAFFEHAEEEIRRSHRYAHAFTVAYIDIDDFKAINDTYGHTVGDDLLQLTTSVMKANCRASDVVARLGGDEFAILLPETGAAAAAETLRKVLTRLKAAVREHDLPATFSVGMMTFERPPENVREMVRLTDDLMYQVKKSGKNGLRHTCWQGEAEPPPASAA